MNHCNPSTYNNNKIDYNQTDFNKNHKIILTINECVNNCTFSNNTKNNNNKVNITINSPHNVIKSEFLYINKIKGTFTNCRFYHCKNMNGEFINCEIFGRPETFSASLTNCNTIYEGVTTYNVNANMVITKQGGRSVRNCQNVTIRRNGITKTYNTSNDTSNVVSGFNSNITNNLPKVSFAQFKNFMYREKINNMTMTYGDNNKIINKSYDDNGDVACEFNNGGNIKIGSNNSITMNGVSNVNITNH